MSAESCRIAADTDASNLQPPGIAQDPPKQKLTDHGDSMFKLSQVVHRAGPDPTGMETTTLRCGRALASPAFLPTAASKIRPELTGTGGREKVEHLPKIKVY